jgi:3-hydroxypropanoate dehydrogenase
MSATSVFRYIQHWPGDREWVGIKTFRVDEPGRIVEHWDELQIVSGSVRGEQSDGISDSYGGEYMEKLTDEALDLLFREARTPNVWLKRAVSDDTLRQLYNLAKWGPTSANAGPARFIFIRSEKAKERLRPTLSRGNVAKTMSAPVTIIIAYDLKFYDKLPKLFPNNPAMRDVFANNPQLIEATAKRNSSLQGAYLILAARALGLECGPMSGFDNAKVDEEFFAAGRCEECEQEFFPEGHVKSNFLCNIGYGDRAQLSPRNPRLEFTEACTLL